MTELPALPDLTTARMRLKFALQFDATAEHTRWCAPIVRAASFSQRCQRCELLISVGSPIASWGAGDGWCHAACLICRACGEWLDVSGTCSGRDREL